MLASCPAAHSETRSKSTCLAWCGFGISPREGSCSCSGPAAARLSPWARCGGGGGRQVQALGNRHHGQVRRASSKQRLPPAPSPRRQKLHVPASRGPPPAVQDGKRLQGLVVAPGPGRRVGIAAGRPLCCGKAAAWFSLRLHGLVLRAGICSKMGFLSCFFWFCFVLNDSISPLNLHL